MVDVERVDLVEVQQDVGVAREEARHVIGGLVLGVVALRELEQLVEHLLELGDARVLGGGRREATEAAHGDRDLLDAACRILEHLEELAHKELVRRTVAVDVTRLGHELVRHLLQEGVEGLEALAVHVLVVVLAELAQETEHALSVLGQVLLEQESVRCQEFQ